MLRASYFVSLFEFYECVLVLNTRKRINIHITLQRIFFTLCVSIHTFDGLSCLFIFVLLCPSKITAFREFYDNELIV